MKYYLEATSKSNGYKRGWCRSWNYNKIYTLSEIRNYLTNIKLENSAWYSDFNYRIVPATKFIL